MSSGVPDGYRGKVKAATQKEIDMPDSDGMLGDMEFETKLNDLGENQPELIRFIARQQFTTGKVMIAHGKRIKKLESQNKRAMGIIGGIGAVIATAFIQTLNYLLGRQS